jgi:regulation of enolase protein 1 (concanavalin A-like superfamily)
MSGFGRDLLAEWTKLRSVRGWALTLLATVVLTVLVGLLAATGSGTDVNASGQYLIGPTGRSVVDDFRFVHQPLSGDGSVTARVSSQDASRDGALAGLMIKDGTRSGASFAAVAVSSGQGVRLLADFTVDRIAAADTAPRWLRLTRSGAAVTAHESADGSDWRAVGTVEVPGLPATAEVGLFVNSPPEVTLERAAGSTSVGERATTSTATFDSVSLGSGWSHGQWAVDVVARPLAKRGPIAPDATAEADGVFTVTGWGAIAVTEPDDDPVGIGLTGFFVGLTAVAALGVLFVTSEYRRGMIRTTFAVNPRRGRVLAAKATVLGATTFAAGLVAALVAYATTQPILRDRGFAPPAFAPVSLTDWPVLRAVVGAAAFLALVALFGLGLGTVLRRSAGAITATVALVLLPAIVGTFLPLSAAKALMLATPAAGFAIQRAKEPTDTLVEPWAAIGHWTGFGVLFLYTAAALGVGFWSLRRRDA